MGSVATIAEIPREVPVLDSPPIVGALQEIRRDYLGTILRAARESEGIARIQVGPPGWRRTFYSVSEPEAVLQVLGQPDQYTKDTPAYRQTRDGLGNGMLTSEGDQWRRQRRLLAPVFTPRRIATAYADIMVQEAQRLVERWRDAAADGAALDAHTEMIGLTSRIIGRILFGADLAGAIPGIMHFAYVNDLLIRRGVAPHSLPMWVPTSTNRRLSAGLTEIRRVVADIVGRRFAQPFGEAVDDMLGLLLTARDQDNSDDHLTDAEVADQVLIFLLAGHETTATTLACSLVELARSPDWQRAVQSELLEVLGDRPPTSADVPALQWTGRVTREAMRLYPPAHAIGRQARHDDTLCGYRIPAGAAVVISPWAVHRSPKIWSDPETFDPRRFDVPDGEFPGGHRYAWFPFGAGPHTCVGMQLALLEAPIVLATILQAFRVTTQVSSIPLQAAVTLRPATPLPLQVHIR